MKYRVTNNGEARTVDFLAVFAKGETKEFNKDEIKAYQGMSGVALASALPEGFELEFVKVKTEGEEG